MLNSDLEHVYNMVSNRIHLFTMLISACTLMSLLQLIKPVKLHEVQKRKLTLFSWGNID